MTRLDAALEERLAVPVHVSEVRRRKFTGTPIGQLLDELADFKFDPLGFVMWAFPWGQEYTDLVDEDGPESWQVEHLTSIRDKMLAGDDPNVIIREATSAGHGVGKALGLYTVVPTPEGERLWGGLQPGDQVFGADGAPTRILQTHRYDNVPMYRVSFDDGSQCDVSSGHLWNVRGRQERRKNLYTWRTLETIEILELGVKRANGVALARQWEIPIQGAAQFEEREIDLHPYVMGVWLGDGSRKLPAYTKPHLEVKAKIQSLGYEVTTRTDGSHHHLQNVAHLFTDPIFDCYSHERYIPNEYKFNTVANRRALFEGLCDTDGEVHAHSGTIGYSTTSKRLADDFIWLARSLGCKATLQPTTKTAWYPNEDGERVICRDCYRVTVNAPFNPFTIEHRRTVYKPSEQRYLVRWIDSIEPLPPADGMCISVEAPDGRYQANDFVVTHNSACVAWIILWAISTAADTRGVITANTDTQLKTKTWAELSKWYQIFKARELFTLTATALFIANDPVRAKGWRIDQIPWSENNSEAFAGLHNKGKRLLLIFDESAGIADVIWEKADGAMTDAKTQIIWCVYGNPTRTTGRFHKACTETRTPFTYRRVDSRTVRFTNKAEIQAWLEEYGEDSDYVRVKVKGMFPRAGFSNFISPELVGGARRRRIDERAYRMHPKILSVDPARFGDDFTVITLRQGQRVHYQVRMSGFDGPEVAGRVLELRKKDGPFAIIVYDAVGNGADLDSALKRTPGLDASLLPVMWGSPAKDEKEYFNQRSEAWGKMRSWLETGQVPDNDELEQELCSLDYGYDAKFRIQLQSKKDCKKNSGKSPDGADSLALSFVVELIDRKVTNAKVRPVRRRTVVWSKSR